MQKRIGGGRKRQLKWLLLLCFLLGLGRDLNVKRAVFVLVVELFRAKVANGHFKYTRVWRLPKGGGRLAREQLSTKQEDTITSIPFRHRVKYFAPTSQSSQLNCIPQANLELKQPSWRPDQQTRKPAN